MSPFYAYAVNRQSDAYSRLLLIFANRAVADEWWREVSRDSVLNNIQRFTPQFYSYDSSEVNLSEFFYRHKEIAGKFVDRMLIQTENDMNGGRGITVVPSTDISDHVSGNWFYIRSRVDPQMHWAYKADKYRIRIGVSEHRSERITFRVTALEEPERTIMIGKDKIGISIMSQTHIAVDTGGHLVVRAGDTTEGFTFEDFAQGKFLSDWYGGLMYDSNNPAQQEVWELVCSHEIPLPLKIRWVDGETASWALDSRQPPPAFSF